jgi:hypothetical protein
MSIITFFESPSSPFTGEEGKAKRLAPSLKIQQWQ